MRETLVQQWVRENDIGSREASAWQICLGGALRGASAGIAILIALGAVCWIAVLQKV